MTFEPDSEQVLVVEDTPADAIVVMEMLESVGGRTRYGVRHVTNLSEAERMLRTTKIDVVLLDLRLPDVWGVDGVKAIRDVAGEVPIVVLTGIDDEDLAQACIDAGAQDYLTKEDLQPTALRRAIGYAITRLREAQLRELRDTLSRYRRLSSEEAGSDVAAAQAPSALVRDRAPAAFEGLVAEYSRLLAAYVDRHGDNTQRPRDMMDHVVAGIGDAGGGPRDLLDIHVTALERARPAASTEQARAFVAEGNLLALEMMGLMVEYYRTGRCRSLVAGERQ